MKDEGKVNSLINPARLMSLDGGSRQFPGSFQPTFIIIVEITRDNSRDLPIPRNANPQPRRRNTSADSQLFTLRIPIIYHNYSLSTLTRYQRNILHRASHAGQGRRLTLAPKPSIRSEIRPPKPSALFMRDNAKRR